MSARQPHQRLAPVRLLGATAVVVLGLALAPPAGAEEQPPPRPTFPAEPPQTTTTAARSSPTTTMSERNSPTTSVSRLDGTATPSAPGPGQGGGPAAGQGGPAGSGGVPNPSPAGFSPPAPSAGSSTGASPGLSTPGPLGAGPALPEAGPAGLPVPGGIGDLTGPSGDAGVSHALEPLPEEPEPVSGGFSHASVVVTVLGMLVLAAWALGFGPPWRWRETSTRRQP